MGFLTDLNPIHEIQSLLGGKKGGGGSDAPKWTPQDQIQQFLGQYNVNAQTTTPDAVLNFLKTTEPSKVGNQGNLATALQGLASTNQWTPKYAGTNPGQAGSSYSQILDPMAVQMFWQQRVAPMFQQLGKDEQQTASQMTNQDTSNLPPAYQSMMQAGNKQQANDMRMLQEATTGAALNQPRVDEISTLLGSIQKAQLQNYYETLRNGIATGTNPFGQ